MTLKTFKPYTKSTRGTILVEKSELWKGKPFKSLVFKKNASKGRNNIGHITSRNRAGGHKKMYRHVDFYRKKFDMEANVERLEYDPNRSCYIMLVKFEDGTNSYYLAPRKIKVGDKIVNGSNKEIKTGNCMPLKDIPVGIDIHNVELQPGSGGKVARSAGSSVNLLAIDSGKAIIKLNSGEIKNVDDNCFATVGTVSNFENKNIKIGSAGRKRWLGFRPKVRGVAMNPIDHPHGGGEGRTSGGRHPSTPWGKPTKGYKTRKNKSSNKFIIRSR